MKLSDPLFTGTIGGEESGINHLPTKGRIRVIGMTDPYHVTIMGGTYRVTYGEDQDALRVCVYGEDGRLRFSLPDNTPLKEIEKFIRVYAIGVADGKDAAVTLAGEQVRRQVEFVTSEPSTSTLLQLAVKRFGQTLGKALGKWKAGAK
jgi:hypothetical protein